MNFNEKNWMLKQRQLIIDNFKKRIQKIDQEKGQLFEAQGWKYIKKSERTVIFIFGEVTFSRKCYLKDGRFSYPVDDVLGLKPYVRFSDEVIYRAAVLAAKCNSYRYAAELLSEQVNSLITKDTILKARKAVTKLYKELDDYQYYKDDEVTKRVKSKILYIEGDGVQIKTPSEGTRRTDLAHFVIHEGVEKVYGKRKKLKNKHEVISPDNRSSREKLDNYLQNHYQLDSGTLLITNSDMGHGYTASIFEEFSKIYGCKWEHFWDSYHMNKKIEDKLKLIPSGFAQISLKNKVFSAINSHKKKDCQTALDTAESLIEDDEISENFHNFRNKLLRYFPYTKPAYLRGLTHEGIGIMESQHCKITRRMKGNGYYWSNEGGETLSRMIIDLSEDKLYSLFFGNWREVYSKIKQHQSVSEFLTVVHEHGKLRQNHLFAKDKKRATPN